MQLEYIVSHIGGVSNEDRQYLVEKPWVSDKSHFFPVEIELHLRQRSEVEKIEIVAHNTFIRKKLSFVYSIHHSLFSAKKIGIFSERNEEGYIGEVQFKSRKTDDQKYELKNIFLNEKCSKLILNVSEAHIDVINNLDSLVGLVDVKLFGKYLPAGDDLFIPSDIDHKAFKPGVTRNVIPDHKYSKELQAMIHAIEKNKQTAVANEDFKMAKSAQLAVRELKKSTKEMEELENDKNEAVMDEDFQRANDLQGDSYKNLFKFRNKKCSDEITALRSNILASIDPVLLEDTMPRNEEIHRPKNLFTEALELRSKPKLYQPVDLSPTEVSADQSTSFLLPPRPPSSSFKKTVTRVMTPKRPSTNDSTSTRRSSATWEIPIRPTTTNSQSSRKRTPSPSVKKAPSTASSSRSRRSNSIGMGTNKFLEKENMIVPAALNRKRSSSVNLETPEFVDKSTEDISEDQVLAMVSPDQRGNVRSAISLFGLEPIAKIYSKHFENRKEGIAEVREKLDTFNSDKTSRYFESITCLLAHILKEPLFNVYKDVLLLWHHFCTSRLPELNLEKYIPRVASESTEILATRVLASEKRLVSETMTVFRDACKAPSIGKAYASKLLNSKSKNLKGRAILVEIIAKLHGVPNDQISLNDKTVAEFSTKCIRTSDPQIRTIGKDLMVKLYKNGSSKVVRSELDKFASSDSNNPTYQKIVREIYNFDGSKPKSEKKKKISFML
ncbi:Protein CBG02946 [Caenorhabditis briggsae]|uniref:Protein CBG02946 n=1 Tax=Caenorhabditis briggsae TaxID=6238 RepID=A8WT54_CAEBR|nr:Protein CBG02946 [Caenorhabditis briggsae]CAP23665.2 Protein CBG02946 [Caenorhabditis briggsae]